MQFAQNTNIAKCVAWLLPIALGCLVGPAQNAHADPVDDYIHYALYRHRIPGLALAVLRNGKVVKLAEYGEANIENHTPVGPQTVFQLASVSKQFAAASILLLAQDGKLHVTDPISKYLKGTPDGWSGITLAHLMSHTSGLPREAPAPAGLSYRDEIPEDRMWNEARKLSLEADPGDRFSYSNLGYNLLAMVIEKVTGRSYPAFVRERIFKPCGMASTRINDLRSVVQNRASGYYVSEGVLKNGEPTSPTAYFGAGAVASTIEDMVKWDQSLNGNALLTEQSKRMLWSPTTLNNGHSVGYGFGWAIGEFKGHDRISHDGLLSGFRSYIARQPEDSLSVILLANMSSLDDPGEIVDRVVENYLPELHSKPPGTVAGNPSLFKDFAGRYEFSNNNILTVTTRDGKLFCRLPAEAPVEYAPISEDAFFNVEDGDQVSFVRSKSGTVIGAKVKLDGPERTIPRIGPLSVDRVAGPDPSPRHTRAMQGILRALAAGGETLAHTHGVTSGARRDFSTGESSISEVSNLSFVAADSVLEALPPIERHGSKVTRVETYRLQSDEGARFVLVYLTKSGLVTDIDVVDE